jgi:hypothetical protein
MDRFINDQNLDRLRRLASVATSAAERKILFGLLAKEKTTFVELQKAGNARINSSRRYCPARCHAARLESSI